MSENLEDDWLDAKLRDDMGYIDDAGFTANVVQKLPSPRPHRSLRAAILIGAALLASAFAYVLSGGGRFVWEAVAQASVLSPVSMLLVSIVAGIFVTGAVLYAAVSRTDVRLG
ncbi:MAG: hypothetical protein M3Z64_03920 [Verrucomicrobiota bacterium]|nr:hypothetical protein [Verrucomicrobiota bacterium]